MIILFIIMMFAVFGKLIGFALKAAWGLGKVMFTLIFLPLILIGLVAAGLVYLALPILAVAGVVMLVRRLATAA